MRPTLPLASAEELADWLGVGIDARLLRSLEAAREIVTARLIDSIDSSNVPDSVHRAATMIAAQIHTRRDSTFGIEAFAVGADSGAAAGVSGWLTSDPTIRQLLRPWLRPAVGVAAAP